MNKKQQIKAIVAVCRLGGCTCDPDINLTAEARGVRSVSVAHEGWCKHRRDDPADVEAFEHAVRALNGRS